MVSLVYFPRRFGMQLPLVAMAVEEKVASRLVDRVFLDVLSPRDKSSTAALIVDFSWRYEKDADSGEEKPGN